MAKKKIKSSLSRKSKEVSDKTTIPVKKTTRTLLKSYKSCDRESYDDVILRHVAAFNELQEVHANGQSP